MSKKSKKNMKWEVKELDDGKWGVFLCKEFWRFKDKPVCYSASTNKKNAESAVERMNNPDYWIEDI
tara:strand:+ start:1542 stop:1739 length:198 start_codon:yes stop_codon:yes gene_type:complete